MPINWWNWLPQWAKDVLAWLPSWLFEAIMGLLLIAATIWLKFWIAVLVVHAASAAYEQWIDPNGWEWKDLAQREVGILFGLLIRWSWAHPV